MSIDQKVKQMLNELPIKELPKIQAAIKQKTREKERALNEVVKQHITSEIDALLSQARDLLNKKKLQQYIFETGALVERYKTLKPAEVKINDRGEIEEDYDHYREALTNTYITIVNKYMTVHPIKPVTRVQRCENCSANLENFGRVKENNVTCTLCGMIQEYWKSSAVEIPMEPSTINANRENYRESFLILVGGITPDFSSSLFPRLDDYFTHQKIPTHEQARSMPLLIDGTKKNTSISLLTSGLSAISQTSYYKYLHPLAEKYWEWKLDEHLAYLEPQVMEEYDLLQPLTYQLRRTDKKSNMNMKVRLCYSMWRLGSFRGPSYYKIVKTPEILEEYEYIIREAYKILGWSEHFLPLKEMEEKAIERCRKQRAPEIC